MGQDIHFYVEVRDEHGVWRLAPGQSLACGSCQGTGRDPVARICARCVEGRVLLSAFYELRDYALFALLRDAADARLCVGGRGLPADACPELTPWARDANWHSHTFATLEELEGFPWEDEDFTEFAAALARMRRLHPDPGRIRAVYWFDN